MRRTLIVGIGSDCGNDSVGLRAATQLAEMAWCAVRAIRSPATLLHLLDGVDRLHIIDACRGVQLGRYVLRCDLPTPTLACVRSTGTHDLDLVSVLHLAEQLQILPAQTTLWCVPVDDTCGADNPAGLGAESQLALDEVVRAIASEVTAEGVRYTEADSHA